MARCLIIGCGCRGRSLAAELRARGHAVRGTTRDPARLAEIEAAGADGFLGDPDRIGTLASALEHVSVVCVLLASALGPPAHVRALHGPRLQMLLTRALDTTVRGVVYEAMGTVEESILRAGAQLVRDACDSSHLPYALLEADPEPGGVWLRAAIGAVDHVLGS